MLTTLLLASLLSADRPDVIVILTDDQGYGDLSLHGNPVLDTPHLDAMAAEGVRLDRFFVCPVCAPTRASLLTGRYHLRTGVRGVTGGLETMRPEEVTLAEIFKSGGYRTGCFGKWHNGTHYPSHPNGQGFDEFVGFCHGHWNDYFDPVLQRNGRPYPTTGYINDVLTDEALRFIDAAGQPYLCWLAYNTPHTPVQLPDALYEKYKALGLNDYDAGIYGMCESLDANVGRLLDHLREAGTLDETLIVFMTDNGPNGERFNAGMKGLKGSVHEGGVRVPCLWRWPAGLVGGRVISDITHAIDLLPTLATLCRLERPGGPPLDGIDLSGLLTGNLAALPERSLFTYHNSLRKRDRIPPWNGAVRTTRHRLVIAPEGDELYDMFADPDQRTNVADRRPEIARRLRAEYDQWFAEVTDGLGLDAPPIPVGHAESPDVLLPAVEAEVTGAKLKGVGWAHDYVAQWTDESDRIRWNLDVAMPGEYEILLRYVGNPEDAGSRVVAEVGGVSVRGKLPAGKPATPLEYRDLVARKEVTSYDWGETSMGSVTLPAGSTTLTLRADEIPGSNVAILSGVVLRKK